MFIQIGDSSEYCSYGGFLRFELYSIVIECIDGDRKFKKIKTENSYKHEFIYERDEEEDIPIGKPLPLSGPTRPCRARSSLIIMFGEWDWDWIFHPKYEPKFGEEGVFDVPVAARVFDPSTKSCAIINYERITESVEAELEFKFDGEITRNSIEIIDGEISATTNNLDITKRVLRSFGCYERSWLKERKRVTDPYLEPGKPIPLDRPVLALPLGAELNVSVDITYRVLPPKKKTTKRTFPKEDEFEMMRGAIKQTLCIKVPEYPQVSRVTFTDLDDGEFPTLKLEVNWPADVLNSHVYVPDDFDPDEE